MRFSNRHKNPGFAIPGFFISKLYLRREVYMFRVRAECDGRADVKKIAAR